MNDVSPNTPDITISQPLSDAQGKSGHIRTPLREIPQLLSKAGTGFALSGKADDTSATSDRCLKRITAANAAGPVRKRGSVAAPKFVEPMHCEAVTELTGGEDWMLEIKFDDYRCMSLRLARPRSFREIRKQLNDRFPAVAEALEALPGELGADGEIVALDEVKPILICQSRVCGGDRWRQASATALWLECKMLRQQAGFMRET